MKKTDVPQQGGLNAGCREVNYAIDGEGRYTLEQSVGWEVKNIALRQAWEAVVAQLEKVLAAIRRGEQSPLAYHMARNQMDAALLAQYAGVARWRVRRHLKPAIFARLDDRALSPYSELFGLEPEQLRQVPERPDLRLEELDANPGEDA